MKRYNSAVFYLKASLLKPFHISCMLDSCSYYFFISNQTMKYVKNFILRILFFVTCHQEHSLFIDTKYCNISFFFSIFRFPEYENEARDISCNVCFLLIPPLSFLPMSSKFACRFHQETCQKSQHAKKINTGQSRSFTGKKCR